MVSDRYDKPRQTSVCRGLSFLPPGSTSPAPRSLAQHSGIKHAKCITAKPRRNLRPPDERRVLQEACHQPANAGGVAANTNKRQGEARLTMNTDSVRCNEKILALQREAERLEEDALYSSKGHFNAEDTWVRRNYWLGVP